MIHGLYRAFSPHRNAIFLNFFFYCPQGDAYLEVWLEPGSHLGAVEFDLQPESPWYDDGHAHAHTQTHTSTCPIILASPPCVRV